MLTSFTHRYYLKLLESFKTLGYHTCTIKEFFTSNREGKILIIRHDVDRWAKQAIRMAKLEYDNNINSTYYFRANTSGKFDEKTIKLIYSYNHEVGYHYETLSTCKGNIKEALRLFKINLDNFRKIAPCYTISMHGSPMSKYNNLDLFKNVSLKEYGLIADASLNFENIDVIYFTDTGGRWNSNSTLNIRDRIISKRPFYNVNLRFGSKEFFEYLKNENIIIYINVHPERWAHNFPTLIICKIKDFLTNTLKRGIKLAKPFIYRQSI